MKTTPFSYLLWILDAVLICSRGVLWALLLGVVTFAYSRAGLQPALLLASLFFAAYQLGAMRASDKETAALKAKLDEMQRRDGR